MEGKGVVGMDENWRTSKGRPSWIKIRKVDETYYAHNIIPPLYPLFLALFYFLGGANTLSYFIPQAILASLTCLFIYYLGKEIFNKKVAVLSGLAVAFYPDLIFWTNFVRTETLFIFLLVLGFLFLVKGNAQQNMFLVFLSAIVFGLASLTRITFIPFIPLLFLWQIFFSKEGRKRNLVIAFTIVLIIVLILLPWCLRNYMVFGDFTPFTCEAEVILLKMDSPNIFLVGECYYRLYNSQIIRIAAFIRDNFSEYLSGSLNRLVTFWRPYTAPMGKLAKIYKGLTWLIIFPLAFWGMIVSLRINKMARLLIIFIFYYTLLHVGSFVDAGLVYRYPIQPFLCIFTAHGFCIIYRRLAHRNSIDCKVY